MRVKAVLARCWLVAHGAWLAALAVSTAAGAVWQDCKPEVLGDGDDGPFAYGQHGMALVVTWSLVACAAVTPGAIFLGSHLARRRSHVVPRLGLRNLATCHTAAFLVFFWSMVQIDSAVLCSARSFLLVSAIFLPFVAAAVWLNRIGLPCGPGSRRADTRPFAH